MKLSMYNTEQYVFIKTALSSCNALIHIVLGMIVGISLLFGSKMDFNTTAVSEEVILLHILLCVPGFILLMSESLMSMTSFNTWSSNLSKKNKIRAHWILQALGSGLGVTGCIIIMANKDQNLDTLHGKFGLVTLIFTLISIIIGIPTLFSYNLQRFVPPMMFKMTHIILGITAYASATACLCIAFNKHMFILWTSDSVSIIIIFVASIFGTIMLINPLLTLCKYIYKVIKARIEK